MVTSILFKNNLSHRRPQNVCVCVCVCVCVGVCVWVCGGDDWQEKTYMKQG